METNLVAKTGMKKAYLWSHFAVYNETDKVNVVVCLACHAEHESTNNPKLWELKTKSGSTSTMRRHLLAAHRELHDKLVAAERGEMTASGKIVLVNIFLRLFVIWITRSMKPIGICEDKDFRKMCHHLNKNIAPLSRVAVNKEISRFAFKLRTEIKDVILVGKWIAMTLDHWTSGSCCHCVIVIIFDRHF